MTWPWKQKTISDNEPISEQGGSEEVPEQPAKTEWVEITFLPKYQRPNLLLQIVEGGYHSGDGFLEFEQSDCQWLYIAAHTVWMTVGAKDPKED